MIGDETFATYGTDLREYSYNLNMHVPNLRDCIHEVTPFVLFWMTSRSRD